jgi:DNA polymerase III epsilon subunit family exonuclease
MTLLSNQPFVFFDTETTGDAPYKDKIIEIAAIKTIGDTEIARLEFLLNPQIRLPAIITEITGITDEMLVGKPLFADVADELLAFVEDLPIVAHNADFDRQFLNHEFMMVKKPTLVNPQFCTWKMAKRILPKQEKYSLEHLADVFGIDKGSSHRASDDTVTLWHFFRKMVDILKLQNLATLEKLQEILSLPPAKCRELYFPVEQKGTSSDQASLF